jgi:hypothetical protein
MTFYTEHIQPTPSLRILTDKQLKLMAQNIKAI